MLEIKGLSFKNVLHDINVCFLEGEVSIIIGANGSGKTVLLKNVVGLLNKTKGEIIFNGQRQSRFNHYFKKMGALIEEPDFYEYNSGINNLYFFSEINGNRNNQYIDELLKKFALFSHKDKLVKFYSLGMRKKLGIIQAIMENQDLVILDEPTNGLDKESRFVFYEIIKELKAKGKIIVIASHLNSDVKQLADRLYLMENGKIVEIKS